MNKITERIKELERNILFNKNEAKKCAWSPKGELLCRTTHTFKAFTQQLEILELTLYLASIISTVEEELETLDSYHDGTHYKVEDVENLLKKLKTP